MHLQKIRPNWILIAIIGLGFALRFFALNKFPTSLFGDEVDVGYQAYSILKTGKDYSGNFMPIHFRSLADWRTPLFLYSAVPTVWLFGLNEWGVRLPAAIFGLLTLPLFYLLIRRIFKHEQIALAATFLMAISPWHLQYSRASFEVTQMLFLIVLGFWAFLKGLDGDRRWLALSGIAFGLTPYSYNTAKLFLPLFILLLVVCYWPQFKKIGFKKVLYFLLPFSVVSLPMVWEIIFGQGGARFSIVSIFSDPQMPGEIGAARLVDSGGIVSKLFHNKYLYWVQTFIVNYFRTISTEFLFTKGDINFRHSIQGGFGEFYWPDIVFMAGGIFYLLKFVKEKSLKILLLGWLLISPISSCITRDGANHATRLILMLPPLLIICGAGVYYIFESIFKTRGFCRRIFIALYLVVFCLYLHRYYVHYPRESEGWWHPGFKEAADYVRNNERDYKYVIWSDKDQPPLIYFLFWMKIDPRIAQKRELKWADLSDAISADNLVGTKYYFGHVSDNRVKANGFVGTLKPDMLYISPKGEIGQNLKVAPVPNSIKLLKSIDYLSGEPVKYVLTGL